MSTLKVLSQSIRVENANDLTREYKVTANVSLNESSELTSLGGHVNTLDEENKQLVYFDSSSDGNINYRFTGNVSYETQKALIDVIAAFIDEIRTEYATA